MGNERSVGPMTFGKKNEEVFLGREIQSNRDYSEVTARMIDEEISKIIRNAQRVSETILNDNQDLLHSMANSLLVHETIDSKDIDKLLNGKKIIRRKPKTKKLSNGKLNTKRSAAGKKKSEPIKSNGKL